MLGLPALIGMIVVGISVGVFAVHLAGGSKRPLLNDDTQTTLLFLQDYPETRIGPIVYTLDRRTAFFPLPDNRTGVVHGVGSKFLTRHLSQHDILSAMATGPADLMLRLHDITWPHPAFSFANETDRITVLDWLASAPVAAGENSNERTHVL
ncbi:hypothetical protein [Phyllobacterium myrsinacearum]|uniref:Uncharacterized protein n=1 Tax=Phyllobacterium myrsinacearum TaxID=28101 RepID=A0A839EJG0_9HYPH|nr:hypothetical protein [Phyllobacterium myrsinacearum]MBA8877616.1 hypothetical protein [Phyllobacterium myrsinacearum]